MKGLLRYSTAIISSFPLIFFGLAPLKGTAQASIGSFDDTRGSIVAFETKNIQYNLMQMASGKCSLISSCLVLEKTAATISGMKESGSQSAKQGAPEVSNFLKPGTPDEYPPGSINSTKGNVPPAGSSFQALTHVVGSHLGIVTRPVTAFKRLFFLAYDTLKDTIGWPAISVKANRTIQEMPVSKTMDLEAWERRLDEMTGSETSYGRLIFLVDGEEFFPRFFKAVEGARRSVNIRTYIFDNDDFAINVADTLRERSEDVDVKVLLDGWGTIAATKVKPDTLPPDYEPPGSVRHYLTSGSKLSVRQQPNPWFAGDHSKTIIVDEEKAFIGGMNFGREYRYEWHDLMVEVDGPVVGNIADDFGKAWAGGGLLGDIGSFFHSLKKRKERDLRQGYPVRILYTRPGDSEIRNTQLEAIRRSKAFIYLENPYFTDDRALNELVKASHRGVDVKVVLPKDGNNGVIDRSNALAANKMLRNGIKVYLLPRMSHVKAAVYDGWACFGSANFDKLSFRVNYEVNLGTSHVETVRNLIDRLFIPDFNASHELTEELPVQAQDYLLELVADQL